MQLTVQCQGIGNVAEYLGVKPAAVYQWVRRHGPGSDSTTPMPDPAVKVIQGKKTKNGESATYGWLVSQLPDIRNWYTHDLMGWDDTTAAHHWVEVDARLKEKDDAQRNVKGG